MPLAGATVDPQSIRRVSGRQDAKWWMTEAAMSYSSMQLQLRGNRQVQKMDSQPPLRPAPPLPPLLFVTVEVDGWDAEITDDQMSPHGTPPRRPLQAAVLRVLRFRRLVGRWQLSEAERAPGPGGYETSLASSGSPHSGAYHNGVERLPARAMSATTADRVRRPCGVCPNAPKRNHGQEESRTFG